MTAAASSASLDSFLSLSGTSSAATEVAEEASMDARLAATPLKAVGAAAAAATTGAEEVGHTDLRTATKRLHFNIINQILELARYSSNPEVPVLFRKAKVMMGGRIGHFMYFIRC